MKSIEWYKSLDSHQKINLKDIFILLCGIGWSEISFIIPLRERIEISYNKLKMEGFDVEINSQ